MKKHLLLLAIAFSMLTLSACDQNEANENIYDNPDVITTNSPGTNTTETLITTNTTTLVTTPPVTECTHSWSDWETKLEPTCQTEGKAERTCFFCNKTEQKPLSKNEHFYSSSEWFMTADQTRKYNICYFCNEQLNIKALTDEDIDARSLYKCDSAGYYLTHYSGYSQSEGSYSYDCIENKYGFEVYKASENEKLLIYGNGYLITENNNILYLKSVLGDTITSSDQLGITRFVNSDKYDSRDIEGFSEGYILAYKITDSYNGTKYEIGVLGVDGNWIAPLSEDNPILSCGLIINSSNLHERISYCGDGCFLINIQSWENEHRYNHCVYNAKTNTLYYYDSGSYDINMDYMISEISFNNGVSRDMYGRYLYEFSTDGMVKIKKTIPSNISYFHRYGFYVSPQGAVYTMVDDQLITDDGNIIVDFSANNINLISSNHIGNGKWLALLKSNEGKYFYSIFDITGNFLFEPIKTDATYVLFENGTSAVSSNGYGTQLDTYKKIVINDNGVILYETKKDGNDIYLKNGVVYECPDSSYSKDERYYTIIKK